MIRFRPLPGLTVSFVLSFAILIGLGVWQIQRLHWKEDLIATVNTRIHAPAAPLESVLREGLGQAEWRHVSVTGMFLNDKSVFLYATGPDRAQGAHVIAPFKLDNGQMVLIDRGFIPEALKSHIGDPEMQVAGETKVKGVLRLSVAPGIFTPDPDIKARLWFNKDASSMAAAMGVTLLAPMIVEADAVGDARYPLGGQTVVDFPNNHLLYAITWFALAFVAAGVYLLYHRQQGRLGF